jgi:Kef-type K+ transport system membrane component KefB/nucleotide-binding universal stress UspA family protein
MSQPSRLRPLLPGLAVTALTCLAGPAFAKAGGSGADGGETLLVLQAALLLLVGRGLGEIMQRFGQPAVIGQLLAGLILGPSCFGWIWPEAQQAIFAKDKLDLIKGLGDIGILMLLLLTGMETDLSLVRRVGLPAIAVAAAGICVPFPLGFTLGEFLPHGLMPGSGDRLVSGLFLGTALSISSIKVVAMVVREMNFMRRNLGQIIVASAIMEDSVGWIIIAVTLGVAGAGGAVAYALVKSVLGIAVFLALSALFGRTVVFKLMRWANDHSVSDYAVISMVLFIMLVLALATQLIGVNTVLGAFVAGVLVGQSPILSGRVEDELRGFITAFLMPIFFGLAGLTADLTRLQSPSLIGLTLGLIAIASIGKFGGAFVGGRLSGLSRAQSLAIGCGMNARGSTEVIVATIGLSVGALTQTLYTMIVVMAVVTTMAMPPMLRWALLRLPLEKDEARRLDQDALDAKGFVSRLERLLVAADAGRNGRFAAGLAGTIGGRRSLPLTVLELGAGMPHPPEGKTGVKREAAESPLARAARDGAATAGRAETKGEAKPHAPEITTRLVFEDRAGALAEEVRKGFDLLFVGIEDMVDAAGAFSPALDRIAAGFQGPIALAIAGGQDQPAPSRIVVPVDGTEASRRGAEMALALAAGTRAQVMVVHTPERDTAPGKRGIRRTAATQGTEKAVLDDMTALARRYGVRIGTAVHRRVTPEAAVLSEAGRMQADLLVIGARRRVGEELFLGKTVAALLKEWHGSVLLLAV